MTLLEVLATTAILGVALLPVLGLASFNARGLEVDRARLLADTICQETTQWLGRPQDDPWSHMQRSGERSGLFTAHDLWTLIPRIGQGDMRQGMIARHDMHMEVSLQSSVAPGLDLLICRVSWASCLHARQRRLEVSHACFLLHDPVP